MSIYRTLYQRLYTWKDELDHKPVLIRGARQVGKTTLVRSFSKEFANYIELNLEREADRELFKLDDTGKLLNAIYLHKEIKLNSGNTLLFIDEIQEEPKAIQQLRYFYEDFPELYIVAAGSLLEFALRNVPSFPVGRIEYMYLHPINFEEYLGALENTLAQEALATVPVPSYAHTILLRHFHDYALVGGMPEIVNNYSQSKSFLGLSKQYNSLWQSYKDDIEKYAKNDSEKKVIRHIMATAPYQLDRIKFEGFGNSNYKSREVSEALNALDLARVIQMVNATTSIEAPIMPDIKKRPILQFIDSGLLSHILLLQGEMIKLSDLSNFYRGRIIHHLVNQELISIHQDIFYKPNFWVREKKTSNSEVDLVCRHENMIIPIEIKSGKAGTLRSLHQFVERAPHHYAIRMYANEFSVEHTKTPSGTPYVLMNLPYYLGTQIPKYMEYFVNNY
ncbi:MAG: ATP-binding protein [Bacteroidales bacterium]|nr:ATP-binding protein [Bacteroidales bacterium]